MHKINEIHLRKHRNPQHLSWNQQDWFMAWWVKVEV